MAPRLAIVAAILMVMVVIEAEAFASSNPRQSERCRQEIQGVQMDECMSYLQRSQRGSMEASNRREQTPPQQCCDAMSRVSEECRCEAVQKMVQQMQQGHEYQGQQMEEVMRKARQLPSMCGMRPQSCEITTEMEEEDATNTHQMSERCRQEIQGVQMNECTRYLQQSQRGVLSMKTDENPQQRPPQQCCQQLGRVSEDCRCDAVNKMVERMQHGEESQGQQMQEMQQTASQLPSMCGMRPEYCQIHGRSIY